MAAKRVALLRGINLGARNKIAMADLRELFAGLGAGDVTTHVQSGNVVFAGDLAADAIAAGLKSGDTSGAQLGRWAANFNHGVDRMRRLVCEYYDGFSFGNFMRHHPELRGTITDLLIGDLFTDRVDKVWQPMESLYPADKTPIPRWNQGLPLESAPEKANELKLPEGWKP